MRTLDPSVCPVMQLGLGLGLRNEAWHAGTNEYYVHFIGTDVMIVTIVCLTTKMSKLSYVVFVE